MRILNIVLSIVLFLDILGYVGYMGVSTYWIYVVILIYVIQQLFALQGDRKFYTRILTWFFFLFYLTIHKYLVDGDSQEMSENLVQNLVLFIGICSFGIALRQNKLAILLFSYTAAIIGTMLIMYNYDLYFGIVGGRYSLTYVNPNKFGEVLVILTLIATKLNRKEFLVIISLLIISTLSRSAILLFIAILSFTYRKSILRLVFAFVMVGIVVVNFFPLILSNYALNDQRVVLDRIETTAKVASDESSDERFSILSLYIEKIKSGNFLLGNGNYQGKDIRSIKSHNIYLEILFSTGIVGLLVTLLVIGSLNLPRDILLSLLVMGIFTHNLFDYSYFGLLFSLTDENFVRSNGF